MREAVLNLNSLPAAESAGGLQLAGWQIALLLFSATLIAYIPAMRGGYVWDDDAFVTNNRVLTEPAGLAKIWFKLGGTEQYYPLTYSSFWLEYRLWGYRAPPSHIINICLQGLNVVLLWRVLRLLSVPGAALGALLFALHPVEVESVAWITERKNVLSGAFYLAAVLAFDRFQPLDEEHSSRARNWYFYPLMCLFYLCALWSKTVTCTLPVALLGVLWWKFDRLRWKQVLPLLPMLAIGLAMGWLTSYMEKHFIGASGPDWKLSIAERLLIAGRALWFYLAKLAVPRNLTMFYPHWTLNAQAWWQWLFPASAGTFAISLWILRDRLGKGTLVAFFYFVVTLIPALGFVNIYPFRYSFVADHFQYLASVGPLALAGAFCTKAASASRTSRLTQFSISAALLLVLSILTWRQNGMYYDLETLYRAAIDRNPKAWIAYNNISVLLLARGQTDEAIAMADDAINMKENDVEAYVDRGNALIAKGQIDGARKDYQHALQLNPAFAEANNDLGNVFLSMGETQRAAECYRAALKTNPSYAEAHNDLGYVLISENKLDDAMAHLQRAIALRPDYLQAIENLGNAQVLAGHIDDAIATYQSAERLNPDKPQLHAFLGTLLLHQGRAAEACVELEETVRLKPDDSDAELQLGEALLGDGRPKEARDVDQRAISMAPDSAIAHRDLGRALNALGNHMEAVKEYQRSLSLSPNDLNAMNELAWTLATAPDGKARNGDASLSLAQRCCELTPHSSAVFLDTLAAAYAENGNFTAAVQWGQTALQDTVGDDALKRQIALHIDSFQHHHAWRSTAISR